jgi:hypothetical protein
MRVLSEQLEAMQKLRGKSVQQKVTVKHIHIHQGGQAILGVAAAQGSRPGMGGWHRTPREHPMTSGRGTLRNAHTSGDFWKAAR